MTPRDRKPARKWKLVRKDPPPTEPVGELSVWASSAEPDEVSASLVFSGEGVDPDSITSAIGVAPTDIKRPGVESEGLSTLRRKDGWWRLFGERVRDSSVEAEVLKLLDRLPPPGPTWDALRPLRGELFCGLFLQAWNRECHLTPVVAAAAVARHLTLRLDIYYEPANPMH